MNPDLRVLLSRIIIQWVVIYELRISGKEVLPRYEARLNRLMLELAAHVVAPEDQ